MSNDNENMQTQDESSGSGGEDLANALSGGGEMEFVTSEEKKPAANPILYLVLVVALAGGGMYFMYKKQGPSKAAAATPEAAKAEQTINTFLTSGPEGIKAMQEMLKDTEKLVQQFLEYPSVTQVPLSDLRTNPFLFFHAPQGGAVDEDDQKRAREKEKLAAIKASEELKLQSIVHSGSRKACMINNTLYEEGQQVEKFVVEKIEPKRVVVKTGTFRFELKISR